MYVQRVTRTNIESPETEAKIYDPWMTVQPKSGQDKDPPNLERELSEEWIGNISVDLLRPDPTNGIRMD